jgi:hypothetical protein
MYGVEVWLHNPKFQKEVVSFTPLPLYPRGTSDGTHCGGGWVVLRASLYAMQKRIVSCPYQEYHHSLSITFSKSQSLYLRYTTTLCNRCGKLTSSFRCRVQYEKGSELAAPCILQGELINLVLQ